MSRVVPRIGCVWGKQSLAAQAQKLEIEGLQDAGMSEDGPAHRCCHEADDCVPLALLVPIGQT
jgi:hypothetical protein